MKFSSFKPRKISLRDSYAQKLRREGRGSPAKPRSTLRRQSPKAKAKEPARRACTAAVIARSQGRCEAKLENCLGPMHHTHEIKPRGAGGSITDPANCLGVCFNCHDWITVSS